MDPPDLLLDVNPASIEVGPENGALCVAWQLANLTEAPIDVLETWLPHGRFFAERHTLQPPLSLGPGGECAVRSVVAVAAETGETVQNAFLNLRVRAWEREWRVLVRIRARRAMDGRVAIEVEAITAHPVGFSQSVPQHTQSPTG